MGASAEQRPDAWWTRALTLTGLCAFAFAQPLFSVLSPSPEFFVVRRSWPVDLLALVAILCFGLPLALAAVQTLVGLLSKRLGRGLHLLLVAILVAIVVLPLVGRLEALPAEASIALSLLLGIVLSVGYARAAVVQGYVRLLSAAALVFPALFLLASPVSQVLLPKRLVDSPSNQVESQTPVVLVVFDELSLTALLDEKRHIDPIRYPHFAQLAREATWFRNATTVADTTVNAVPAILTGRHPDTTRLPAAADYPENLFTWLAGSHDLQVWESMTHLCPERLCPRRGAPSSFCERVSSLLADVSLVYLHTLLPDALVSDLPPVNSNWNGFWLNSWRKEASERDRSSRFLDFVDSIGDRERAALFYFHSMLPHYPWDYLPSGRTYQGARHTEGLHKGTWSSDEWSPVSSYQRYLLQVGYVDRLLGQLLEKLRASDVYEKSLLIVTSDHGTSFIPGQPRRTLGEENHRALMPVPLLVKQPGQRRGEESDRNVETIDILPTIAAVLESPLPWAADGHSLLDAASTPRTEKRVVNHLGQTFRFGPVLEQRWKPLGRKLRLFSSGGISPFALASPAPLLDRSLASLPVRQGGDYPVTLESPYVFEAVDPSSSTIPAQVSGRIEHASGKAAVHLAVAVNGTVRAVTRTFAGTGHFSAMIPEASLRPGRNDVEVLVIDSSQGSPSLLRQSVLSYSLLEDGFGAETIVSSDGERFAVELGATRGYAAARRREGNRLEISGWALDASEPGLVHSLLVFVEGSFAHSGVTTHERPDVSKEPSLLESGFRLSLAAPDVRASSNPEVRVFAVSQTRRVSELSYALGHLPGIAYKLERDASSDEEWLRSPDGRAHRVVADALQGAVESVSLAGGRLRVTGWSLDPASGKGADTIVLFADHRLLHVGRNPVRRPDLVKRSGNEDYRWSGFLFGGAAEEISVTRGSAIRVFALSRGGNATELEH